MAKLKVLFLGTGNSCRSQMAEGWARHLKSYVIDAYSAGIDPKGLNPDAVEVMREAGVDISNQKSKHVDELAGIEFDYVVTVCDQANESCPIFPGKTKVVHVGFDDPPKLAKTAQNHEEALGHSRRVRDVIRDFVDMLPTAITARKAEIQSEEQAKAAGAEASAEHAIEFEPTDTSRVKHLIDGPLTRRDAALLVLRLLSLYELLLCVLSALGIIARAQDGLDVFRYLRLQDFLGVGVYGSTAVILWVTAWPLSGWISRTKSVATDEVSAERRASSNRDLLAVGIALIGIWMIAYWAIPALTFDVLELLSSRDFSMLSLVVQLVKVIIGGLLFWRSHYLASKWDTSQQMRKSGDGPL